MEKFNQKTTPKTKVYSFEDLRLNAGVSVILHNDDRTPIDYVVIVLLEVFQKDIGSATAITFEAHTKGVAHVAHFSSREAAEEKLNEVKKLNQESGHNLLLTIDEED